MKIHTKILTWLLPLFALALFLNFSPALHAQAAAPAATDIAVAPAVTPPATIASPSTPVTVSVPNFAILGVNWQTWISAITAVIIAARTIVKITPTPRDDTIMASIIGFLKHLGLHIDGSDGGTP